MSRIGKILGWFGPLAIALVIGFGLKRVERDLLPEFAHRSYVYGDLEKGGRSNTRLEMRDGTLHAYLSLEPGHPTPFTGFGFAWTDSVHPQGIDLTAYDRFEIEMRSPNMTGIGYHLVTWVPGFTDIDKPLTGLYLDGASTVGPVFSKVVVPISVFAQASWWPQAAGVAPNTATVRMDLAKNFEFKEPVAIHPPRHDTLEIRSIRAVGENWIPLFLASTLAILYMLARFGLERRFSNSTSPPSTEPAPDALPTPPRPRLSYPEAKVEKVDLPNRRDLECQALLTWIGKNYHKEAIGVEDASRETGIPVRKIPQLLKDHSGMSFPAFVASIRIAQACRLLRETDRQVTEIALAVGFSNPSHFHRVFKTETGTSPSVWRDQPEAT